MSPSSIGSHIPQSTDVILDLPPQFILYRHTGQVCSESSDRLVVHVTYTRSWEDMMLREYARRVLCADSIESLEGFLIGGQFTAMKP